MHNHHATLQHEHEEEHHEVEGGIRAKSLVQRSEPTHVRCWREEEEEEDGEAEGGGADAGIVAVLQVGDKKCESANHIDSEHQGVSHPHVVADTDH